MNIQDQINRYKNGELNSRERLELLDALIAYHSTRTQSLERALSAARGGLCVAAIQDGTLEIINEALFQSDGRSY